METFLDLTRAREDFELALRQDERRQCLARLRAAWDKSLRPGYVGKLKYDIEHAIANLPGA